MKLNKYVGAGILFWYLDKETNKLFVLLGKRKFGYDKKCWSIPGGGWEKIKDGYKNGKPNLQKTAIRETKEEIFFNISNIKYVKDLWSINTIFYNWSTFAVRLTHQKYFKKFNEFSKLKWFSMQNLPYRKSIFVDAQIETLIKKLNKKGIIII